MLQEAPALHWTAQQMIEFLDGVVVLPDATPGVYIPKNRPAIGNLMTMFDFSRPHFGTVKLPGHQQPRRLPSARTCK